MSAITAVTFDKPSYAPGDLITATVTGNWEETDTLKVATPDGATGSGSFTVIQPVTDQDASGRKWAPVSNNGTTAVLTTTA